MNSKQYELLKFAYELSQHAEVLASTDDSMKKTDKAELEKLEERYTKAAERMKIYYQRAVTAYRRLYGMPNLVDTHLTLREAGELAHNEKVIMLLITEPGWLSKKAKVEQYNKFCKASL